MKRQVPVDCEALGALVGERGIWHSHAYIALDTPSVSILLHASVVFFQTRKLPALKCMAFERED